MLSKNWFITELKKIEKHEPKYLVYRDDCDIEYTAEQMISEIENNTPVGNEYCNKFEKVLINSKKQ